MKLRGHLHPLEDCRGQGLMEYALILLLIALVAIGGLTLIGGNLTAMYSNISSSWP